MASTRATHNVTTVYPFTAPTTGLYDIMGSAFAQDLHRTTTGGTRIHSGLGVGSTSTVNSITSFSLSTFLNLNSSDIYDFAVSNGSNGYQSDSINLTLWVTAVPEPKTAALMLAGLAAVGFVAKRRKS